MSVKAISSQQDIARNNARQDIGDGVVSSRTVVSTLYDGRIAASSEGVPQIVIVDTG